MFSWVLKIVGTKNQRELKKLFKQVEKINSIEKDFIDLSDEELKAKTSEFKQRLAEGATLDDILPEAFATVREAGKRVLQMRHFDVQLIGGMVLNKGKIAEMRTGEGKTLVASLVMYLRALAGKGAHLVTVNDYLAKRDSAWMGKIYEFLGLTVGVVYSGQDQEEKRQAYECDITYGTNNEFGFDYLRDNMSFRFEDKVQRELYFALVDEVDSILIDEARTPLIISGQAEDSSQLYMKIDTLIPSLEVGEIIGEQKGLLKSDEEKKETGDFIIDEKQKTVELTEEGHQKVEQWLVRQGILQEGDSLYAPQNLNLLHHVNAALKAHHLFHLEKEYLVVDGEIVIVDEHTGRTMQGRRWSDGLHQAVEAKEGVKIQSESQTLASTTFQNFFRLYDTLAGMTGTADTEAYEFNQIYGLDVVVIPPNKTTIRDDANDLIYMTGEDKLKAIVADVKKVIAQKRPVLVGTASIEYSEIVSRALKAAGIKHEVLNAKNHEREADIIAQAGSPGVVTIATNMAGRGTDIILGGNWEAEVAKLRNATETQIEYIKSKWQKSHDAVLQAGGLHVLGTERHESRRIDNQLRGRAGRQGDPGSSRFFLSLDDALMRIFAGDWVRNIMTRMNQDGEAIEHKMVTNAVEKAQRKVEGRNFDIRKQLLEYDDVANEQRKLIYKQRDDILVQTDLSEEIKQMRADVISSGASQFVMPGSMYEEWNLPGLEAYLENDLNLKIPLASWVEDENFDYEVLCDKTIEAHEAIYAEIEKRVGTDVLRQFEQQIMLQVFDMRWKEHLANMDQLRQGIHLRGYAQKNPKQEYKKESFELFQNFLSNVKLDIVRIISHIKIQDQSSVDEIKRSREEEANRNNPQRRTSKSSNKQANRQANKQAKKAKRKNR